MRAFGLLKVVRYEKLRARQKTHDEKRYTCSHPPCVSLHTLPLFSTWTKLQAHTRTLHPPTCPYPERNGKSSSQQRGLEAHLKARKGRAIEGLLNVGENTVNNGEPEARKRRGGEHGRDWICDLEGCTMTFKSVFPLLNSVVAFSRLDVEQKTAFSTHHNVSHLHKRDFVCTRRGCGRSYGYKYRLLRHVAQTHKSAESSDCSEGDNTKGCAV